MAAKKKKDKKYKRYYFNKEDMKNLGAKSAVGDYIAGIIHQDKILFTQVVVLPRVGLNQGTPFRPLDKEGNLAMESGKPWESFEVPAEDKKVKIETNGETLKKAGKIRKS